MCSIMNYLAKVAFLSLFCFQSGCYGTNFIELDRGNSCATSVRRLSLPTSSDKNDTDSLPDLDELLHANQYEQHQIAGNVVPNANEAAYPATLAPQIQSTAFPNSERNTPCYGANANGIFPLPPAPTHLHFMIQRCIAALPSLPMMQTCSYNANEKSLVPPKSSEVLPIEANDEETNRRKKKAPRKKTESYKPKKSSTKTELGNSTETTLKSLLETNIDHVIEKGENRGADASEDRLESAAERLRAGRGHRLFFPAAGPQVL